MTARDTYSTFGRRFDASALALVRKKAGMSLRQVMTPIYGENRGTTRLLEYETGKRTPTEATLRSICDVLGCSIYDVTTKESRHEYQRSHQVL